MTPEQRDNLETLGNGHHSRIARKQLVAAYDSAPSPDEAQDRVADVLHDRMPGLGITSCRLIALEALRSLTDREAE